MNSQLRPLFAFFAVTGALILVASILVYGLSNVLDFFALIGFSLFVLWGVYKVTDREEPTTYGALYQEEKPLGGTVTYIGPSSARIDTKEGTSFIAHQQAGGIVWLQQIDPASGQYVGQPFQGKGRNGQPDHKSVARAIKYKTRGR